MQRTRRLFRGEAEYRGRAFGIRQTLCGSGAAAVAYTLGSQHSKRLASGGRRLDWRRGDRVWASKKIAPWEA
jgi:hypothetical protein